MATTNFIDKTTVIQADWLNDVDALLYDVFAAAATALAARTAIAVYSTTEVDTDIATSLAAANAAAIALVDDLSGVTDAATARNNLGLASMATQAANAVAITGGNIAGITDIAVADGGTGASAASGARTNLGLVISTDVQAYDADTLKANVTDVLTKGFATTATALSGTSVTPVLTAANIFTWPITANSTLNNPTVTGAGVWYIYATVNATGGYTMSFGANINTISGTFDGTANAVNRFTITSDGTAFDLNIDQRV